MSMSTEYRKKIFTSKKLTNKNDTASWKARTL